MAHYMKIKVLLVDDHPFVLQGIRTCLAAREQFEIVGEASSGAEAVQKAAELAPSVIIMDISMPGMNGLEATRQLRRAVPDSKVLILSIHEGGGYSSEVFRAGAHGYISKSTSPLELIRAVETLHRGETFFDPRFTQSLLKEQLDTAGDPESCRIAPLSLREREVLTLVAEGYSNKEAAGVLGVSVRTVEKHRERIMDKLSLHSVVELTKYAIANHLVQVN